MINNELQILDNLSQIQNLLPHCLNYIQKNCQNDPLLNNYINLRPDKYFYFNCLMKGETMISFGAVEKSPEKWGDEIVRVLTRFWIHPEYRSKGSPLGPGHMQISPILLKPQLDFLKTNQDIKLAMITSDREYDRSFTKIIRVANTVSENPFKIIPGVFNVCHPILRKYYNFCQQSIAVSSLCSENESVILERNQIKGYLKKLK